jgi:hypothetical protein
MQLPAQVVRYLKTKSYKLPPWTHLHRWLFWRKVSIPRCSKENQRVNWAMLNLIGKSTACCGSSILFCLYRQWFQQPWWWTSTDCSSYHGLQWVRRVSQGTLGSPSWSFQGHEQAPDSSHHQEGISSQCKFITGIASRVLHSGPLNEDLISRRTCYTSCIVPQEDGCRHRWTYGWQKLCCCRCWTLDLSSRLWAWEFRPTSSPKSTSQLPARVSTRLRQLLFIADLLESLKLDVVMEFGASRSRISTLIESKASMIRIIGLLSTRTSSWGTLWWEFQLLTFLSLAAIAF